MEEEPELEVPMMREDRVEDGKVGETVGVE